MKSEKSESSGKLGLVKKLDSWCKRSYELGWGWVEQTDNLEALELSGWLGSRME